LYNTLQPTPPLVDTVINETLRQSAAHHHHHHIIFNFKTNPRKKYKYNTGKPENPGIIKAGGLL